MASNKDVLADLDALFAFPLPPTSGTIEWKYEAARNDFDDAAA
jgi:hypothetical protein